MCQRHIEKKLIYFSRFTMSNLTIPQKLKAELPKFSSFEEKHEFLKTLFDEKEWSTAGNSYMKMLNHMIAADVDPKFIVWLKSREILVETNITVQRLVETNNLDLIKELFDENIVTAISMSPYNLLVSVEAVEFLYKNYNVGFRAGINCYEVMFDNACNEERSQKIFQFLQSINYQCAEPIRAPITEKLIKFCVENDLKIHVRYFRGLTDAMRHKLVEYKYEPMPKMADKPFGEMTMDEKIEAIKDGKIAVYEVEAYLFSTYDHEFLQKVYPLVKDDVIGLPNKILRTNNFDLIKVLANFGVVMQYSHYDEDDHLYHIFNAEMFETWKKLHDHNLVVWHEKEMLCALYAPDHRFIKYALANCPAEIREPFVRSL